MTRNLDIALLRAFVTIVDTGSIGAAARGLNLTQGAVSQQLARLELALNQRLLERDHRGARLSRSGANVLDDARAMVALNDRVCARHGVVPETVRLGAPPDVVSEMMPELLKRLSRKVPSVEISLSSAASPILERNLAAGEIDLALLEHPLDERKGSLVHAERLVWIGATGGVAKLETPLPVSISHELCRFKDTLTSALERSGRTWRSAFDNESFETTLAAVRADLAVTASMKSLVPTDTVAIEEDVLPALPSFAISVARPDRKQSQTVEKLAELLAHGVPLMLAGDKDRCPAIRASQAAW